MKYIAALLLLLININSAFMQSQSKIFIGRDHSVIDKKGNVIFEFTLREPVKDDRAYQSICYPESNRCILRGSGKIITIPENSSIYKIVDSEDLFIVQKYYNDYSLINDDNKTLIPFGKYKQIEYWKDDLFLVKNKDGYWGVVNSSDSVIIPFLYSYFYPYSKPLATHRHDSPYYFCLLDEKGNETLPFHDYNQVSRSPFSVSDSIIVGYQNDMETYNLNGDVIIPRSRNYQWICPYSEGYAFFQNSKGLWGVLDKAGNEIIPAIYTDASNNYGNRSQPVIIKPHTFSDGLVCMQNSTGYGALNKDGEVVIPFKYNYLSPFVNGLAIAALKTDQYPYNIYGI